MKIDINTLRKAVNQKLISEQIAIGFTKPIDIHGGSHTSYDDYEISEDDSGDDEKEMIKQNLFQLSVYAAKLHDLIEEGMETEEWVQEKVVEATSKISDVYHYLEYEMFKKSR